MEFLEYYFKSEDFIKEIKKEITSFLTEEESIYVGLNPEFISRLLNYLESRCFVSYGEFDHRVANEIRKYVKADNSYIKKIKQRINDIIVKARNKFLNNVRDKVEKIKVLPKKEPKPPQIFKPLAVDDAFRGDSSYEPNP